jgi:hypothetical protein
MSGNNSKAPVSSLGATPQTVTIRMQQFVIFALKYHKVK